MKHSQLLNVDKAAPDALFNRIVKYALEYREMEW